ncbi:hypothetical protein EJB05_14098, partial [Eragrostis curvula]
IYPHHFPQSKANRRTIPPAADPSMAAPDPSKQTPAAVLIDVLVEEFLLRLPPADPASLVRAALVCKPWCRVVSGQGFRRRFREFHRTPPVLGILCNHEGEDIYREDTVRFVPTASSFPRARTFRGSWRAVDAHHGRVLLRSMLWDDDDLVGCVLVVWDPVTHAERVLPSLTRYPTDWNAAVLCAATPSGTCDHLDCHGPFLVVVLAEAWDTFVHIYSSESGKWSEQQIVVPCPSKPADWLWPTVLAGNALYFMLQKRTSILEYNLGTRAVSVIHLPPSICYRPDVLTTTEDGRLGFATVHKSTLYLWSREDGPGDNVGWAESRVIQLDSLLPANALSTSPTVVGFAAGVGIFFVRTNVGVFTIDLKSRSVRKIHEAGGENIIPYMGFYTLALRGAPACAYGGQSLGSGATEKLGDICAIQGTHFTSAAVEEPQLGGRVVELVEITVEAGVGVDAAPELAGEGGSDEMRRVEQKRTSSTSVPISSGSGGAMGLAVRREYPRAAAWRGFGWDLTVATGELAAIDFL